MIQSSDELSELWNSQPDPGGASGREVLESIEKKAKEFDRTIARRNLRETLAGGLVAVIFTALALRASHGLEAAGNWVLAASGVWVILYLRRYGREAAGPNPDETLAAYRKALLTKYEHQIRLLKSAKYWYVLPFWAGLMLFGAGVKAPVFFFVAFTAFAVAVWWLNEVKGVSCLRQQRDELLKEV